MAGKNNKKKFFGFSRLKLSVINPANITITDINENQGNIAKILPQIKIVFDVIFAKSIFKKI